jgi:hypothetical protein
MRPMRAFPFLFALLVGACALPGRESLVPLFVQAGTAGVVFPILEARYASGASGPGAEQEDTGLSSRLLGEVMRDGSPAADEAGVVLLAYHLGEADGEVLLRNLTLRGKRVLPYLRGYRDRSLSFPGRTHLDSLQIPTADRKEFFDTVIEAVENGDVIGID